MANSNLVALFFLAHVHVVHEVWLFLHDVPGQVDGSRTLNLQPDFIIDLTHTKIILKWSKSYKIIVKHLHILKLVSFWSKLIRQSIYYFDFQRIHAKCKI